MTSAELLQKQLQKRSQHHRAEPKRWR